jgi:hypothetical protein
VDYVIFTYPNCDKCEAFRGYLEGSGLSGVEYNLAERESKIRVREYLDRIRRDETGAMILPIVVVREGGAALGVFNSPTELDGWLKSRA